MGKWHLLWNILKGSEVVRDEVILLLVTKGGAYSVRGYFFLDCLGGKTRGYFFLRWTGYRVRERYYFLAVTERMCLWQGREKSVFLGFWERRVRIEGVFFFFFLVMAWERNLLKEQKLRSRDFWLVLGKRRGAQGQLNLVWKNTLGMFTVSHVFYHFRCYAIGCF